MYYVSFCVWLLSLNVVFNVHAHCSVYQYFVPFYGCIHIFLISKNFWGCENLSTHPHLDAL